MRVARGWNDRVGGDESGKLWIIVSGPIVVEPGLYIKLLAVKSPARIRIALISAYLPPRVIFRELDSGCVDVGDDVDPTQVVIMVEQLLFRIACWRLLGREDLRSDSEIFSLCAARSDFVATERVGSETEGTGLFHSDPAVVVVHVNRSARVHDGIDTVVRSPVKGPAIAGKCVAVLVRGVELLGRGGKIKSFRDEGWVAWILVVILDAAFAEDISYSVIVVTAKGISRISSTWKRSAEFA